jgi:hypothetical protein
VRGGSIVTRGTRSGRTWPSGSGWEGCGAASVRGRIPGRRCSICPWRSGILRRVTWPFWIYENGRARVERRVPMLPFSREQGQLRRLKDRLAMYRLVFGQPRQEDLLAHLEQRAARGESVVEMARWRISLAPPCASVERRVAATANQNA